MRSRASLSNDRCFATLCECQLLSFVEHRHRKACYQAYRRYRANLARAMYRPHPV